MAKKKIKHVLGLIDEAFGEQKFYDIYQRFTTFQINVTMILILASSFITLSVTEFVKLGVFSGEQIRFVWLAPNFMAIMFFALALFLTFMGEIVMPPKVKRFIALMSFMSFSLGILFFFITLAGLLQVVVS